MIVFGTRINQKQFENYLIIKYPYIIEIHCVCVSSIKEIKLENIPTLLFAALTPGY